MVQIYNKIRDCSKVGLHSWFNSSVGIIRKPNNSIKRPEIILPPKKSPMFNKLYWIIIAVLIVGIAGLAGWVIGLFMDIYGGQ